MPGATFRGHAGRFSVSTLGHRLTRQATEVYVVELRPELTPPVLDEAKVRHLAELASSLDSRLDGADPGQCEELLAEFNRLVGETFTIQDFQGIYGAEEHETWVRRVLVRQAVRPVADVTRSELAEVVRRAMPQNDDVDFEAYMAIFDANVPLPGASNLIFYPSDYDFATNLWGGGRQMNEYDPTPEQIVEWALAPMRPDM